MSQKQENMCIGASLVVADENTEDEMHHLRSYGETAKNLAAAFIMDFEDANFLYKQGMEMPGPIFLLYASEYGKSNDKCILCLSNLKHLVQKGITTFNVACSPAAAHNDKKNMAALQ